MRVLLEANVVLNVGISIHISADVHLRAENVGWRNGGDVVAFLER